MAFPLTKRTFGVSRSFLAHVALIGITLLTFWRVRQCDFTDLDDDLYIRSNPYIQDGLTWKTIQWAFSADLFRDSPNADYWQPVTFVSRILDIEFFGLDPSMHHFVNLIFHMINALLLFYILHQMTGFIGRSFFVAALFAIHPQHVESVAWITERKDLLSGLFWLLTIWAYCRYVEFQSSFAKVFDPEAQTRRASEDTRPFFQGRKAVFFWKGGWNRYLLVIVMFVLGLMSKPMNVTLPFVLLLLDIWPLRRASLALHDKRRWGWLCLEKIPLLGFSILSVFLTCRGHSNYFRSIPWTDSVANAFVAYTTYLLKTIYPTRLAIWYPHPGNTLPLWEIVGSFLFLMAITVWVIRERKSRSYLLIGWFWFLGTLVPTFGLINARADRFTYMSLIGIFIMIAWGVPELLSRWRWKQTGLQIASCFVLAPLMAVSWHQLHYWRNCIPLIRHAIEVTENNSGMHRQLGHFLAKQGKIDEAIQHYQEALRINPQFAEVEISWGVLLVEVGKLDEAIMHYKRASQIDPTYALAYNNIGVVLEKQGKIPEAIRQFALALQFEPEMDTLYANLGKDLVREGLVKDALKYFGKALELNPSPEVHYDMAATLFKNGRVREAKEHLRAALALKDDFKEARLLLYRIYIYERNLPLRNNTKLKD